MQAPIVVEVEINSLCNLKCPYCPNFFLPQREEKFIDPDLFDQILNQLAEMKFDGRFSFHLYNEPLLHEELELFVQKVKEILPKAVPVLFTNGTLLTDERYRSLMDAGIYQFIVTLHEDAIFPKRKNQILLTKNNLKLTNRGGLLNKLNHPIDIPCYAPMEMLIINCHGEVLLCFEDAKKKVVMGNLQNSTIQEIWFSKSFSEARQLLASGKRNKIKNLCALCDNIDYPVAGLTKEITCAQ